jgi:hypothetical protein
LCCADASMCAVLLQEALAHPWLSSGPMAQAVAQARSSLDQDSSRLGPPVTLRTINHLSPDPPTPDLTPSSMTSLSSPVEEASPIEASLRVIEGPSVAGAQEEEEGKGNRPHRWHVQFLTGPRAGIDVLHTNSMSISLCISLCISRPTEVSFAKASLTTAV